MFQFKNFQIFNKFLNSIIMGEFQPIFNTQIEFIHEEISDIKEFST